MTDSRVARRYALALFQAATSANLIGAVESDLNTIVHSYTLDPRFGVFLSAPHSRKDKEDLLGTVFGDNVTSLTMQVLRIMLEKGRENEIEAVRLEYVALRRKHEGVVLATVTTALPLEEDLKLALVAKLEKSLGAKIETEYKVDPDLIGGIRVAYGDYVLDGSARGSLRLIREKLRYDVLKQV